MRDWRLGSISRLIGMLAILMLSAVQQPVSAAPPDMQPCYGSPGCFWCWSNDEEGNLCIVRICHENVFYHCF